MANAILRTFRSFDDTLRNTLADISSIQLKAYAVLELAKSKCDVDWLSPDQIVECLEEAGSSTKEISVKRALARASSDVRVRRHEGKLLYRLMISGKRKVAGFFDKGKIHISRVEEGKPRTARLELSEILKTFSGTVRVCDPYYGIRTLDSLDEIPKRCAIRFLTFKTNEAGRRLSGALRDFKNERRNFEIRRADNRAGLHDRYLVSDDQMLILGHGLKDIGGKESFIIRLEKDLVPDLIKSAISAFERKWNMATAI